MPTQRVTCGHPERKHAAKGMCGSCYQMQFVSSVPVTACIHTDRPHAGKGMCTPCYMAWYHQERKRCGNLRKAARQITNCPHVDRTHSANGMCKGCASVAWKKANPEAMIKGIRRRHLKTHYGLSLENYEALWDRQKGVCANARCRAKFPKHPPAGNRGPRWCLQVDHDHLTGKIRGLLCANCNATLGSAGDSIAHLHGLIDYLKAHAT